MSSQIKNAASIPDSKFELNVTHELNSGEQYANKNLITIQHLKEKIKDNPHDISAHYALGRLYLEENNLPLAKLRFLSVLDLNDEHIPAHFYTGVISMQQEELQQAEWHFQTILSLNPEHVPSLVNLGALALKRDSAQIAISYFTQALMFDNDHIDARKNLAATFLHYDRFENALTHYYELQKKGALDTEDWYNMGVATMSLERFDDAIIYYQTVLNQDQKHYAAANNLAAIYIRQGKTKEAINFLHIALENNSKDESSQFMLNALQQKNYQPKHNNTYVKNLFDNYAINFDQHLKYRLNYTLPQQSFLILQSLRFEKFQHALDLGCGTGLSGILLRDYCHELIGVDLSEKMLKQASLKNCYDNLIENDIVTFLKNNHDHYDLIQALDVLPYFGDLHELFCAIVPRLQSTGFLLLSAEISHDKTWKIQKSMRFCHHLDYLIDLAKDCGLTLVRHDLLDSRKENDQTLCVIHAIFKLEKETLIR